MVDAFITPLAAQAFTFVAGLDSGIASNASYDALRHGQSQVVKWFKKQPSIEQLPDNPYLERASYRAYLKTCQMLLSLEGYVHPVQRAANPHSKGQIHVLKQLDLALKHINGDDWRAHLPHKAQFANAQQLVSNALSHPEADIAQAHEPLPDASGFTELEQWLITFAIKDMNNRALDAGQTLPTESLLKRFKDPNTGFIPVYKHFIGDEIKHGDAEFFNIFVATEVANTNANLTQATQVMNTLRDAIVAQISAITPMVKAEFEALSQQITAQTNKLEAMSELQQEIKNALSGAQFNGEFAPPNPQPRLEIPPTQDSVTHFTQQACDVIGREKEQQILRDFLHAPTDTDDQKSGNLKWIQIAGQGGQGKSRLALELVIEARHIETNNDQAANNKQSARWKAGMLEKSALTEFLTFADTWQPDAPHLMVFDYLVGNEAPIAALFKTLTARRQQFRYPVRIVLVERQAWNKGGFTRQSSASHLSTSSGSKATKSPLTNSVSLANKKAALENSLSNQDLGLNISLGQGNAEWYDKLAAEGFTYLSETRFGSGVVELGRLTQQQLAFLCLEVAQIEKEKQQSNLNATPAIALSHSQIEQQLAKIDTSGRPLYAYFLGLALAQNPEGRYYTKEQLLDDILQHEYRKRWVPTVQGIKNEHALPEGIDLTGQTINFSEQSFALRFAILACIVRIIDIKQVAQQANWPKPQPDEIYLAQVINDNPVKTANLTSPRYLAGLQPDLLGEYFVLLQLDDMWDPEPLWQLCWQVSPSETAAFLLRIAQDFATHDITQRLLNIAPPNSEGETALEGVAADISVALHDAKLDFPNTIVQAIQRAADNRKSKHAPSALSALAWCYYSGNGLPQNNEQAVKYWQQAAELKNPNALRNLAFCYINGELIEKDEAKALPLLQQAAEKNDASAIATLGWCFHYGKGVEQDLQKANQLWQQAAELGNAAAMTNLGYNYENGNGVEQDLQKANQLFQQAVELGNARAMVNLGTNYANGRGVEQDFPKANQLCQKAAKLGDAKAMLILGLNYSNGNGVEQDLPKANQLWQQAVELGNTDAMVNLGVNYQNGNGVEQDIQKANQLYQQAAELGNTNAMVNLGINYQSGNGVEQDLPKANQLYQQTAELGNADAMFNLGYNYSNGNGVEQDLPKANQLYQQAVELGNTYAMVNLGLNYENGNGVEQDLPKANQLYQKAAELGSQLAAEKLADSAFYWHWQAGQEHSAEPFEVDGGATVTYQFEEKPDAQHWRLLESEEWKPQDIDALSTPINRLLHLLNAQRSLPIPVDIHYCQRLPLSFYPHCSLVELQGNMIQDEAFTSPVQGLTAVLVDDHLIPLTGKPGVIHQLNPHLLQLQSESSILEYLAFFCCFMRNEEGPFTFVHHPAQIPWLNSDVESIEQTDKEGLSASSKEDIAQAIKPPAIIKNHFKTEGYAHIEACVCYAGGLFTGQFKVHQSGMVEMEDDEPIAEDLPIQQRQFSSMFYSLLR